MRRKVAYVISNLNKGLHFEWVAASRLARDFDLSFTLLNSGPSVLEDELTRLGLSVRRITYRGKKDLPGVTARLAMQFLRTRPDVVHTHLIDAELAGLTAAFATRVPRRFYTRHHANLNHVHYPHAVYYDRAMNLLATDIVATCENGRELLMNLEQVPAAKIKVVHFGFDLSPFVNVDRERIERLRSQFGLEGRGPVIGVISRYMEYKGLQYIIPAFERLRARHPDAVLFLANTSGREYAARVAELLGVLPKESYREVPFVNDSGALYQLFDVFVHAPIDRVSEAFGQIYVEALAAGIPSVFTLSGVASEFIKHEKNALVVDYCSSGAILGAIERLLGDRALRDRITEQGRRDVERLFPIEKMIERLAGLYEGKELGA